MKQLLDDLFSAHTFDTKTLQSKNVNIAIDFLINKTINSVISGDLKVKLKKGLDLVNVFNLFKKLSLKK
jgi:hypothetical protein